jgi:uncharacterized protein
VIDVEERDGAASFSVRVTVRASRNAIEGQWQGALKIRLAAPPVEGRANEALRRLLAEHLNVLLSAVEIVSGERSRTKRLRICGITADQIRELAQVPGR